MLLQFTCSNYRSIKEEVVFSMLASSESEHTNELIAFKGNDYLRSASIYGANGSGKTTLLLAIALMRQIVLTSNMMQPGDSLPRFPHKLSLTEPTQFTMIFEKNGKKYGYGFSYKDDCVAEENLSFWPNQKKATIFQRTKDDYAFGASYTKQSANCKGRLKPNKLLLSLAANETDIKEVAEAFLFFKEDIVVYPGEPNNWLEYSARQLLDSEMKATFLRFIHQFGSDLVDVQPKVEQRVLSDEPVSLIDFLQGKQGLAVQFLLHYKQFSLNLEEESAGIQQLFRFLCPLIDIMKQGKVFICDELESHLHPAIIEEIVKDCNGNKASWAQMIFTTHDTDLLDLDLFRRDQIWFTELKPDTRSTDLYALPELRNVRKDENIRKGYISGKYGALMMVSDDR